MSNKLVVAKRAESVKFNAYYATVLIMLTLVMGILASSGAVLISKGEFFLGTLWLVLFATSVWSLGASYISIPMTMYLNKKYAEKRYSELDIAHSRAIKLLTQLPLRKTFDIPVMMSNLALMRLCQGNYESAEELFRKAYEYISQDKRLRQTYAAAVLLNNLGCACMRRGNLVEAEVHATNAIELLESPKNKMWKVLRALPNTLIGVVHAKLAEFDTAEEHLNKALEIYTTEKAPAGTITTSLAQGRTQIELWLSYTYIKQGKGDEAKRHCDTGLALFDNDPASVNTLTIEVLYMLANEFMNVKDFERAEKLLEIAYGICLESPFHPDAKPLLNYFEKLLLLTDRQSEVADMRAWLRHVDGKKLIGTTSI